MHTAISETETQHPSVQDFIETLGDALSGARPQTVAQLWEAPAFVLSDEGAQQVNSSREVADFFAAAAQQYQSQNVVETRPEIEDEHWLTDRLVTVTVRWSNLDVEGNEVGHERITYTLRIDEHGALRVRGALIGHAEKRSH